LLTERETDKSKLLELMLNGKENIDASDKYSNDLSLLVASEYFSNIYNSSYTNHHIDDYHLINLNEEFIVPQYIYDSLLIVNDIPVKQYQSKLINDYYLNRYILHFKSREKNHSILVKDIINLYINTFKYGRLPDTIPYTQIDEVYIDECYPKNLELSYEFLINCVESYRLHESITKVPCLTNRPLPIYSKIGMYIVDKFHMNKSTMYS